MVAIMAVVNTSSANEISVKYDGAILDYMYKVLDSYDDWKWQAYVLPRYAEYADTTDNDKLQYFIQNVVDEPFSQFVKYTNIQGLNDFFGHYGILKYEYQNTLESNYGINVERYTPSLRYIGTKSEKEILKHTANNKEMQQLLYKEAIAYYVAIAHGKKSDMYYELKGYQMTQWDDSYTKHEAICFFECDKILNFINSLGKKERVEVEKKIYYTVIGAASFRIENKGDFPFPKIAKIIDIALSEAMSKSKTAKTEWKLAAKEYWFAEMLDGFNIKNFGRRDTEYLSIDFVYGLLNNSYKALGQNIKAKEKEYQKHLRFHHEHKKEIDHIKNYANQ